MEQVNNNNNNNRGSSNNNGGSNRSSKVSEKLLKNFNPLSSCLPPPVPFLPRSAAVAVSFGFLLNAFIAALLQRPFFAFVFCVLARFFYILSRRLSLRAAIVKSSCISVFHAVYAILTLLLLLLLFAVCVWPTVLPAWQCLGRGERGGERHGKSEMVIALV